nr:F-box only protein 6-like [Leptinotarsa decemlineata]
MGNSKGGMGGTNQSLRNDIAEFEFHGSFEVETLNGLYLNDIYIPEELILNILSYVPAKDMLALTLVCKKWCNIIKSESLWMDIYNRTHSRKAKNIPWYVYYCYFTTDNFSNLIKNGNGQEGFKHWKIIKNYGDEFKIENPPMGCDPLPSDVPEFYGQTGCFATSFHECFKIQEISLIKKRLLMYIMDKFMPHLYVSEWMAGRFDCGCTYTLGVQGHSEKCYDILNPDESMELLSESENSRIDNCFKSNRTETIAQWQGREWQKVEILVEGYPTMIQYLYFVHEGRDTQFWKGHYGSKMAGGVLRFIFESIEPLEDTGVTAARRLYEPR